MHFSLQPKQQKGQKAEKAAWREKVSYNSKKTEILNQIYIKIVQCECANNYTFLAKISTSQDVN